MNLCFLPALAAAYTEVGGITQREYIEQLLAHFKGVRHPQDEILSISTTLATIEPWARSLRGIALGSSYEPVEGILFKVEIG